MNRMIRTAIAVTFVASLPALAQEPAPAAPAAQDSAPAPAAPAPASPDVTQPGAAAKPAPTPEQNAEVMSAISNLSPIIGDVQIVGPWVEGERNGVWRTIMTQALGETKGSRFFFQQVEERQGKPVVVASTEVTEIAEVDGAIVGYRADAPAEGQESNLTLFFDIVPLDGEISETYELFVAPGQPYRFGPASN
jgi:predicted secreted protein